MYQVHDDLALLYRMKPCIFSLLTLLFLLAEVIAQNSDIQPEISLTSKDGRRIEVKVLFVGTEDVHVQLTDNREFQIPFNKLVAEDVSKLKSLELPKPETPTDPTDAVVLIETSESSGTGFFVHHKGERTCYQRT